jgi:hypothetical protein
MLDRSHRSPCTAGRERAGRRRPVELDDDVDGRPDEPLRALREGIRTAEKERKEEQGEDAAKDRAMVSTEFAQPRRTACLTVAKHGYAPATPIEEI